MLKAFCNVESFHKDFVETLVVIFGGNLVADINRLPQPCNDWGSILPNSRVSPYFHLQGPLIKSGNKLRQMILDFFLLFLFFQYFYVHTLYEHISSSEAGFPV